MFNAGYKKASFCGKAEVAGTEEKWTPARFEGYSPKMFASIKEFTTSLASRCIPVRMLRTADKNILNSEVNVQDKLFQEIRDKLYPVMLTYHTEVDQTYREISDNEILGREWELWKSLFSIAKVIDRYRNGSTLFDDMKSFALEVLEAKKGAMAEDNLAPIILQTLADCIKSNKSEDGFYSLNTLVAVFRISPEESLHWLDSPKCHAPGRWISHELRKLGIIKGKAIQRKIDGRNEKGYILKLEDIEKKLKDHEL
jgi:hemoglobin-like flavoprotein